MVWEATMKTTLDIPDPIFRQAKARAALRGVSLRQFVTEALEEKVCGGPASVRADSVQPPWMRGFGALADLHQETRKVNACIAEAFEGLDEEDRQ
jgi:hypothetical protein